MRSKRAASRAASQEESPSDDSSSGGDDQFVILPRPRRATRKIRAGASSSRATEEAVDMAEGRAIREAREARESDMIQKVEHPLKPSFEYTLRRVDHRHPRRPITPLWEKISPWSTAMKIRLIGTPRFMITGFGTTFRLIGISLPSRI
jgi:hypothetical protein